MCQLGGGQRQFSGASFPFAEPEGSHQGGEMQKEARPTVCQVFPAGDSSVGKGCLGRTLAWRRISGSKAAEWRKESQKGTERGRRVDQRCSRGISGDLPKKLKNWHVVVKGGPYRARRRTWVKLLWDWIETLG